MPHIGVVEENAPVSVTPLADGSHVVDFGRNLAGWTRLRVTGPKGATVVLKHAEVLMHPPYGPANGSVYQGNLRTALATDTYTLRGDAGGEVYEPHFTYHGFQFVQVFGYPGTLAAADVTQVHFRTLNAIRTHFKSSSYVVSPHRGAPRLSSTSRLVALDP